MKNLYNKAAYFGHLNSRQPLAEGQLYLDQMNSRSGHTIYSNKVRGQQIPVISDLNTRDNSFLKIDSSTGKRVVNLPTTYDQNVMKFIDKVKICQIPNTNEEAYQIVTADQNGENVVNLIMPTDIPVSETQMSEGYTVRLFGKNDKEVSPALGWIVNPLNGIIHFSSDFHPGSAKWIAEGLGDTSTDYPRVECFYYTGQMVDNEIEQIENTIDNLTTTTNTNYANQMVIVPFSFSTVKSDDNPPSSQMIEQGACYHKLFAYKQLSGINVNFQTYSCIVPGYVLNVISLQTGENINCKINHLKDSNDTKISIDLPYKSLGQGAGKPISGWTFNEQNLAMSPSSLVLDTITDYSFIATSLFRRGGKIIIDWNNATSLQEAGDVIGAKDEYLINLQSGQCLASCCGLCGNDVQNKFDQSVNINVNLTDI